MAPNFYEKNPINPGTVILDNNSGYFVLFTENGAKNEERGGYNQRCECYRISDMGLYRDIKNSKDTAQDLKDPTQGKRTLSDAEVIEFIRRRDEKIYIHEL